MNLWNKAIIVALLACIVVMNACQKDKEILQDDVFIGLSTDTLRFDTVFTSLGSATRILKLYNDNNGIVSISNISMESGESSFFRLNVDGIPGSSFSDVEILPNDSLYIFAEVTIDPDMPLSASPFVIEEFLNLAINGNEHQVLLEAWGQNANYLPNRFAQGATGILSCNLEDWIWDDPRPYVIYGHIFIDSCNVILPPGTKVHVHGGVTRSEGESREEGLIGILPAGRITSNGTVDNPVVIEGDRLEKEFENQLGQWSGITINGSKGSSFNHTIIKNASDGILVGTGSELKLSNTQIFNTSRFGLVGINAKIEAENCIIHTNGANSFAAVQGGDYRFQYCTLANFGNEAEALLLQNYVCLDDECNSIQVFDLSSNFINCIIAGDDDDEILLDSGDNNRFQYFFQNSIVVVDELIDDFPNFLVENCSRCDNVDIREERLFLEVDKSNYHLDTMSVAEMNARPIVDIRFDLDGNMRDAENPDIGCYEFQN